ncbi:hypothetical protein P3X46_017174 [Hevea brasiliensis]|uniref:Uncharacterized protein n=1 Tax=Hevea brasiliensis TaxID=3981 RepID=A0ABQ9M5C1_HEVBR|nr:tetraspanin-11 [Hevea brasiliensis]KAJ9174111.1 hypothetical protein P3X46_017174 [Hevea brasiliensis]
MVRVSNIVLGIFNVIILIMGLAAIGTGFFFYLGSNSKCEKGVENQLMIMGAALFVVSLLGLIGSCYRINFLLILYLVVMFLLILGFMAFTIFAITVTNETSAKMLSHTKIMNFRTWIRDHFVNDKNWNQIRNCLIDARVCKTLGNDVEQDVARFYKKNLSPIQSGCCKPPTECGFTYKNATFWIKPMAGPAVANSDCTTWSNEQKTLCYNCESCKAGMVDNIRHKWKQLAIFNVCITIILIVFYSIGCCARKNNSTKKVHGKFKGYRAYP